MKDPKDNTDVSPPRGFKNSRLDRELSFAEPCSDMPYNTSFSNIKNTELCSNFLVQMNRRIYEYVNRLPSIDTLQGKMSKLSRGT